MVSYIGYIGLKVVMLFNIASAFEQEGLGFSKFLLFLEIIASRSCVMFFLRAPLMISLNRAFEGRLYCGFSHKSTFNLFWVYPKSLECFIIETLYCVRDETRQAFYAFRLRVNSFTQVKIVWSQRNIDFTL